jgi:hypothetical protein
MLVNPVPSNGAVGVALNPTLSVDVSDPDGDSMDVSFYDASGPTLIGTDAGVLSGGTASVTWPGRSVGTTYNWYAVADDNIAGITQSATWSFTTITISCSDIFTEDHEDGDDWGETSGPVWTQSNDNRCIVSDYGRDGSNYEGRIQNNAWVEIGIDTIGKDTVSISYYSMASNLDSGETVRFQISYNGGSNWYTVASSGNHAWTQSNYDLSTFSNGLSDDNSYVRISFIINANKNDEYLAIDDIIINACMSQCTNLINENFDGSSIPGWSHGGTQDEWNWGTCGGGPGSSHSGSKCVGTDMIYSGDNSYNYNNNTNCWWVTPEINLNSYSYAAIKFFDWYMIEDGGYQYDKVYVEVYYNSAWNTIDIYSGSQQTWTYKIYDLSAYVGNSIQIRWRLLSDTYVTYAGYYLDDVIIRGCL